MQTILWKTFNCSIGYSKNLGSINNTIVSILPGAYSNIDSYGPTSSLFVFPFAGGAYLVYFFASFGSITGTGISSAIFIFSFTN